MKLMQLFFIPRIILLNSFNVFFLSFGLVLILSVANASPTGGTVVGGEGQINQSGLTTTITQSTARMAIDWQTFNVAVDENVQFIQPSESSIALNRILDNNPSQILGRIDANGQIILVNPRGVVFGRSAVVNAGGIIASALDIAPDNFMNGSYFFSAIEDTEGRVVNQGLIEAATGGSVTLLGKAVTNEGLIKANLGRVNLAAGSQAVLTFDAAGFIGVEVTEEVLENQLGLDSAVLNSGEIDAKGGQVLLTASVSRDLFSSAVNNEGIVSANSIEQSGGKIFLSATGGDVNNSGTLDVSATGEGVNGGDVALTGDNVYHSGVINAAAESGDGGSVSIESGGMSIAEDGSVINARSESGGTGGEVHVLGNLVGLFGNASIDASGENGGGVVLIGGDYQGASPEIQNAMRTFVDEDSAIYADAFQSGDGGTIIVWADELTAFYGTIIARGGVEGGDGGFAEISGKEFLDFQGEVNLASRLAGIAGTLLLDPRDIVIGSSGSVVTGDILFNNSGNSDIDISALSLAATLRSGTSITLQARDDITVNADVDATGGTGASGDLTLEAGDDMAIVAAIRLNDSDLTLRAGDNGCGNNCSTSGSNIISFVGSGGELGSVNVGSGSVFISAPDTVSFHSITAANLEVTAGQIRQQDTTSNFDQLIISDTTTLDSGDTIEFQNPDNDFNIINLVDSAGVNIADANSYSVQGTINSGSGTLTFLFGRADAGGTLDISQLNTNRNITVFGGGGGVDELVGLDQNNTWTINGATTGNFGSGRTFSGVEQLTGQDNRNDTFNFQDAAALSMIVDGGTGTGTDIVNVGGIGGQPVTVNMNNVINIENVNGTADNLAGADSGTNTWTILGADNGEVLIAGQTTVFSGFNAITGGSVTDIFNIDVSNAIALNGGLGDDRFVLADGVVVSAQIDGGDGSGDEIDMSAYNANLEWNLVADGDGNIQDLDAVQQVADFVQIERLVGNDADNLTETFRFVTDGVQYNFTIDGRRGINLLSYLGLTTGQIIDLNNFLGFTGVEGTAGSDFLIGPDGGTTWTIDTLNGGSLLVDGSTFTFSGIENLTGGDNGSDNFQFESSGSIDGILAGGDGTAQDFADFSLHSANTIYDLTMLVGIEDFTGGSGNETFVGGNQNYYWEINGTTSGQVTPFTTAPQPGDTMVFRNVENIQGGTQQDIVLLNQTNPFGGTIDAGAGDNDILSYENYGSGATINFNTDVLARNFEEVRGSNFTDNLIAPDTINVWSITDPGEGRLNSVFGFSEIENITGGSDSDTFQFNSSTASMSGTLNGGGGTNTLDYTNFDGPVNIDLLNTSNTTGVNSFTNITQFRGSSVNGNELDTLTGFNSNATWSITENNGGTLDPGTGLITFTSIESLVGGANRDEFIFSNGVGINGTINGLGGDNIINYSSYQTAVTYNVGASATSTGLNGSENITEVIGTNIAGINDTFGGNNAGENWEISGVDSGRALTSATRFTEFEILSGGDGNDEFRMLLNGQINGTINGGLGNNTITYSTINSPVTLNMQNQSITNVVRYENIGEFEGSLSGSDQIIGANTGVDWEINGTDTGTVDGVSFSLFEQLTGGDGQDRFLIRQNGIMTGLIRGGLGDDEFTVEYSAVGRNISIDGNGGAGDQLLLVGDAGAQQSTISLQGPGSVNSTINTQNITASNVEQVDDSVISNTIAVTSTAAAESISMAGNTIDVNGVAQVVYSNKTNVSFDSGGGGDTVDIQANVDVPGTLTLTTNNLTNSSSSTISANQLFINGAAAIANASRDLIIDTNQLMLTGITGNVFINELDGLELLDSDIGGNLNLVLDAGNLTASQIIEVAGTTTILGAAGSNVQLTNSGNSFIGAMTLDGLTTPLGNVTINSNGSLNFATLNSNTASILSATGNITQSGSLVISGLAQFNTGTGDILLNTAQNDFGSLAIDSGNDAFISNNNDLNIDLLRVANTLDLNVNGAIIDNNGLGTNVEATTANLQATAGIGSSDQLETAVQNLNLMNTVQGNIDVINLNGVTLLGAVNQANTGGDISVLTNVGNLVVDGVVESINGGVVLGAGGQLIQNANVIAAGNISMTGNGVTQNANITGGNQVNINVSSRSDITMVNGSVTRTSGGGNIVYFSNQGSITLGQLDAGYAIGDVTVESISGSIFSSRLTDLNNPNVIADQATFIAQNGVFGSPTRRIVIQAVTVFGDIFRGTKPVFIEPFPQDVDGFSGTIVGESEIKAEVGGNQRTQVDSLAVIDPAIFTEVKNYRVDDYPVKLPVDQLLSEDEDEKKKRREDPDIFEQEKPLGSTDAAGEAEIDSNVDNNINKNVDQNMDNNVQPEIDQQNPG